MKGRPILGAVSGLFFGVFFALLLQQFGVWPLDSLTVIALPILGLGLGLGMAAWAPLGRARLSSTGAGDDEPGEATTP